MPKDTLLPLGRICSKMPVNPGTDEPPEKTACRLRLYGKNKKGKSVMKKAQRLLSLLVSFIMVAGLLPSAVYSADAEVAVSEANFPDDIFRNYVSEKFDTDKDGSLSANEIAAVREISVSGLGIADLAGVEYFTALVWLDCDGNQLTALDVSKNTALEHLDCGENQLDALDVTNNTMLFYLCCDENRITALDVQANISFMHLDCSSNQLTALDLSKNKSLVYLNCGSNKLNSLNVQNNLLLEYLGCYNNQNLLCLYN